MNEIGNTEGLTRKELLELTGAKVHLVTYLRECNKLPIVQESPGRGYTNLYHPDCVEIIRKHMNRRLRKDENEQTTQTV